MSEKDSTRDKLKRVLNSGLESLYHEIRADEGSLRHRLLNEVPAYYVNDSELSVSGSLEDIASEYGLEDQFRLYMQSDIVGGVRGYLGTALHLVTSLKDGLEDVIESVELGVVTASGAATGGVATIPVTILGNIVQIPIVFLTQTAYSAIAGLLGYASGTYDFSKRGTVNYAVDVGKGYVGAAINVVPVLGSLIEIGTNLDDKQERIIYSSRTRAKYWLFNKIREMKGLPLKEKSPDLTDIVKREARRFRSRRDSGDYVGDMVPALYGA